MRIGYFADGPWSHRSLERILSDDTFSVSFICARFDNPDPVLKNIALMEGIPFVTHENVNSDDFFGLVNQYVCDVYVSMSFNQIFKEKIINHTLGGIINCHAGKLPFYRGRNVLNWALINDEDDFGVTAHYIDSGVDTGDIINQQCYPISDEDDYSTMLARSYEYCADVLYKSLLDLAKDQVRRVVQKDIHPTGFYCSQRKIGDEILNWKQSSRDIFNFVRAICKPGPQARTFLSGEEIKINRVELILDAPVYKGIPGAVLGVEKDFLLVKTADSFVKVVEWSGNVKVPVGSRLESV